MKNARILIADDHALLAEGVASLLRPNYDVVGIVSNGRQLVTDAELLRPDLITLDIGMPLLNGLEAAKKIVRLLPRVRLVFVTQQIDLRYLCAALSAGATAFVAKQSASTELIAAITCALQGKTYITPLLAESYNALEPRATTPANPAQNPLTPRQREVLQLIAEGHTLRAISETLQISRKTVEFHKDALMTTLGLRTTAELTRYAVSEGIVNA